MAVVLNEQPVGEVVLKKIDRERKCCAMGIGIVKDTYKKQGHGTEALNLIYKYAFSQMGMQTVYADSVIANLRSQHVLHKVGFIETHRDAHFVYYRCDQKMDCRSTLI